MSVLDWWIVGLFFAVSFSIGLFFSRKASKNLDSYFASDHRLSWWLAGTSIAATAFSSDTPLLITGMVRRRGIWGTWEVLALGISTMLAVFVFSKLWKRSGVLTEVELVEHRYSGTPAAFLRGFKAIYWGLLYNCFIMGAWPVTGLTKVLQEATGLERTSAIISCVAIGTIYTSISGLWGVVFTDAFQFIWAMIGSVMLSIYAVHAAGGISAISEKLSQTSYLAIIPPINTAPGQSMLESPFGWFLGLILIQWWAWKNADGGGVAVQRLISCKDERQAMGSVLWFSIAHYCLRAWPWIITALASLILVPNEIITSTLGGNAFIDHERAYPKLITLLLPSPLRGVMIAAFFAAFLSSFSTQLNWGSSYLVNDFYKRFINKKAKQKHYLLVSKMIPFALAIGAMLIAFQMKSIGQSFTLILNLTAGIGPVYILRWFWWRINPWSEIAAMTSSIPILILRPSALSFLGLGHSLPIELSFMVIASALVWVPITLLTKPSDKNTLAGFYEKTNPPGLWGPFSGHGQKQAKSWRVPLLQWAVSSIALLASALGPLQIIFKRPSGFLLCAVGLLGWWVIWRSIKRQMLLEKPF